MRSLLGALLFMLIFSASVLAEQIRYDNGGRRDCFIPLVNTEGIVDDKKFDASDINIEGIVFDPIEGSMVLINNEFYKEGDHVNGANIITIFRDRVILSQSDEEKTLWIREEIVSPGESSNAAQKRINESDVPPKNSK